MAYQNKNYDDNGYINKLIEERKKRLSDSFKKAKSYLSSINFFEKSLDEKIDFLNSEDGLLLIEGMSADKMSFILISSCFEINQTDLHTILRDNPNIYDARDRGTFKEIDEVEESLKKLATGFFKDEITTETFKNERGSEATKQKTYRHYFPPNFMAASYFLQMKRDKEWKQNQLDLEVAKNTIKIELEIIGGDELNME
jgi:hypothetical protein